MKGKERIKSVDWSQSSSDDYFSDNPIPIDQELIDVPKKWKWNNKFRDPIYDESGLILNEEEADDISTTEDDLG